jgi:uncharacterized protein
MSTDLTIFSRVFCAFSTRRRLILTLLGLLTGVAALYLPFVDFDTRLEIMLPRKGNIIETLEFLREARFSDKVVISLSNHDPGGTDDLHAAADRLAADLDPAYVRAVLSDVSQVDIAAELDSIVALAPQMLGRAEMDAIEGRLSPEAVERELRARYLQLLKPEGSFVATLVRRDPLNFSGPVLQKLQGLTSSMGYDVRVEKGHLVSRDGRHVLVVLETPIAMTDGAGSRRLLEYLRRRTDALAPAVSADIVCGHWHTVSNEQTIRADIKITLTVAAVGFFVLFLAIFRDPRATFVFIIPFAAVVVALALSAVLLGRVSALVIGLGSVIAGIAVDYGIHVYVAVKAGTESERSVSSVAKPVCVGAMTTMGVFVAFFFSSIEGYRQLACFSLLSLAIALVYALFVLPQCLPARGAGRGRTDAWWFDRFAARYVALGAAVALGCALVGGVLLSCGTSFDSDATQLDGTAGEVLETEKQFQNTWGRGEAGLGLLVSAGADYEAAAALSERATLAARTRAGGEGLASLTDIWPTAETRRDNVARWHTFWTAERKRGLRETLAEKGKPFSFAGNAFDPFFEWLEAPGTVRDGGPGGGLLARVTERFVRRTPSGWHVIAYFADEEGKAAALGDAVANLQDEGIFVVSRRALAESLSHFVNREVLLVTGVALALILLVTFGLLRSLRPACIGLVPALAGCVWVVGIHALTGHKLNIANLIAGVVVMGLCIDYGIFMTHAYRHRSEAGTTMAVTLSAVTTLTGAGVLLFARHPVLLSIGRTLVTGVVAGYIAAMVGVPALCRLWLGAGEGGEGASKANKKTKKTRGGTQCRRLSRPPPRCLPRRGAQTRHRRRRLSRGGRQSVR